jgi:hypothetical protein
VDASLSGPVLLVGTAVVWQTSGCRWFGVGRPAFPDSGLDLETDAIILSSLTADCQGAAHKVVAGSPEFIKLLAGPVGNIVAEVPDDVSVDKDSDCRRLVNVIATEPARRRTRIPGVRGIFPAMLTS